MPQIHDDYPFDCTEEEILIHLKEYSQLIVERKADINIVMRFTPLIQLGTTELQRRFSNTVNRSATKLGNIAIGIGIVSILIALIGLLKG